MKKILFAAAVMTVTACQAATPGNNTAEQAIAVCDGELKEGDMAPDFTLPTIEGTTLKLSDLRGKYVVVDFWGSWCGWCIKGMPEMKKYYAKYSDKMEIVGVDCGDPDDKWRASVEKLELPWRHVKNERGEADITPLYGIKGYPTKIVIDPEGKIAKIVIGEDPVFYTSLDEMLAE